MGDRARLSPEAQTLLACARLDLTDADRDGLAQALAPGLDWGRLTDLAERHGLRPLLYRHLDAEAPEQVPRQTVVDLWTHHERRALTNRLMAEELLRILGALEQAGIPALPYKGPVLAASLHGDLALREFGDLDILLRPQQVLAAKALLQAHGYRPLYDLKPAVEAAFLASRAQYHLVMVHGVSSISVELHWMTDPDFPVERIDDEQWWAGLDQIAVAGGRVRCFSNRELMLVLCLHGSKHHWTGLGWLVDVAELARRQSRADWDWILARAKAMACERRLALGLHLAGEWLGARLPLDVQRHAAAVSAVPELAHKLSATWFTREHHSWGPVSRLRLDLKLDDRGGLRLRHLANVLFTPSLAEWSAWPLPRVLHFLYLPLRLVRLLWKYGTKSATQRHPAEHP